ncbi:major facilitator superfamily domain-containing protein [Rhodotorula diobovata]|uniref:Major facilitator superfamily domain-containing protein n=1 Tax=Rhodotorula diobovata TaxID=5288 RepID=A0A5C5G6F4_9BASI|nr:major facilitator superfamily domain-containing protein [Rhodotorula diobovata]
MATSEPAHADERSPLLQSRAAAPKDDFEDPTKLPKGQRNAILVSVWIGVFLGALDGTIVATLISDVSSSFKESNQAGLLGTSYLLSTATFTPLYGRLADIIGRRAALLIALTLFTSGTALCGLAPSMVTLLIGRLIAGMGGGGLMAVSSIVASDLIPLKQRALFQGLANLWFGAGSGLGGPLGGFISDRFGWRTAFLFQLPILILASVLVFRNLRYRVAGQGKSKREMIRRIDYLGSLTLVTSLGSLLFALSFKNDRSLAWSSPYVWAPLIVFGLSGVAFVLVEAFWSPEPVMPLRILKDRNGLFVALINFTVSFVSFSILYFYPQFFEIVKQKSASEAGAHLLPNSIALSVGSLFAGWVIRRTGRYYWLIVVTSGLPVVALTSFIFLTESSGWFHTWFAILPSGFGFASVITAGLIALIASVDRSDMATATGLTYLFRYVGQVVGVASSASLLQAVLSSELKHRITGPDAPSIIDQIRHVSTSIPTLPPLVQVAARESYRLALRAVFILNLGVAVACWVTSLPIREYPLPGSFEEEEESRRQRGSGSGTGTPREGGEQA